MPVSASSCATRASSAPPAASATCRPTRIVGFSEVIGSWKIAPRSLPRRRAADVLGGRDHVLLGEEDRARDDGPRVGGQQAEGGEAEHALARARLADEADDLAGRDRQPGAAQRVDVAAGDLERHVQVLDVEDRGDEAHRAAASCGSRAARPRPSAASTASDVDEAVALQVGHRLQRVVVRAGRGAADAVGDDAAAVVVLVGVGERVVHADVGQPADEQQRVRAVGLQDELELGGEERRVAALADEVLVGPRVEAVGELGRRVALQAVDALGAVELAAEVDERALVDLLDEDDRHARRSRAVDELDDPGVALRRRRPCAGSRCPAPSRRPSGRR